MTALRVESDSHSRWNGARGIFCACVGRWDCDNAGETTDEHDDGNDGNQRSARSVVFAPVEPFQAAGIKIPIPKAPSKLQPGRCEEDCSMIRWLRFTIRFLAVTVAATTVWGQERFKDYINRDDSRQNFKHYESGLFLGMFNSQDDADLRKALAEVNPVTLKPYDVVFAFGISGNQPWVKAWEVVRVAGDNLQFSPLTNYGRLDGLAFDMVVAHSNGNDVVSNAIKAGILKANVFVAIAPPAGFKDEARNLPVKSVEIYRTPGDPVAEKLGKKTVFGALQKLGDLNIGIITPKSSAMPLAGFEVKGHLPEPALDRSQARTPAVREFAFGGPAYFTKAPHDYDANAANIVLKRMYDLDRTLRTAKPGLIGESNAIRLANQLNACRAKFPTAAAKFDEPRQQVGAGGMETRLDNGSISKSAPYAIIQGRAVNTRAPDNHYLSPSATLTPNAKSATPIIETTKVQPLQTPKIDLQYRETRLPNGSIYRPAPYAIIQGRSINTRAPDDHYKISDLKAVSPPKWREERDPDSRRPDDSQDTPPRPPPPGPGVSYEGAAEAVKAARERSIELNKLRNPGAWGFPGKGNGSDVVRMGEVGVPSETHKQQVFPRRGFASFDSTTFGASSKLTPSPKIGHPTKPQYTETRLDNGSIYRPAPYAVIQGQPVNIRAPDNYYLKPEARIQSAPVSVPKVDIVQPSLSKFQETKLPNDSIYRPAPYAVIQGRTVNPRAPDNYSAAVLSATPRITTPKVEITKAQPVQVLPTYTPHATYTPSYTPAVTYTPPPTYTPPVRYTPSYTPSYTPPVRFTPSYTPSYTPPMRFR